MTRGVVTWIGCGVWSGLQVVRVYAEHCGDRLTQSGSNRPQNFLQLGNARLIFRLSRFAHLLRRPIGLITDVAEFAESAESIPD